MLLNEKKILSEIKPWNEDFYRDCLLEIKSVANVSYRRLAKIAGIAPMTMFYFCAKKKKIQPKTAQKIKAFVHRYEDNDQELLKVLN